MAERCSNCGGNGVCPVCDGSGVKKFPPTKDGVTEAPCGTCGTSGKCILCKGDGKEPPTKYWPDR